MNHTPDLQISHYGYFNLSSIVEMVNKDNYEIILMLCEAADKEVSTLKHAIREPSSTEFILYCENLVKEARDFVKNKRTHLLPYLVTLTEKDEDGHDCRNCGSGGACNLKHDLQMREIKESQIQLKDLLDKLYPATQPIYGHSIYAKYYGQLTHQMSLLEKNLNDLLQIEKMYIVPKIKETQKNIFVHD